jgi:hypothetical protein
VASEPNKGLVYPKRPPIYYSLRAGAGPVAYTDRKGSEVAMCEFSSKSI